MLLQFCGWGAFVVLRGDPGARRAATHALGASRWKTVWCVVLPTARPGLATACILGVARGIGETSPVLLTSGNAQFMVTNPTDGVMNSLPLFIYSTVRSGEPQAIARAFAAASVLMAVVLILFVVARLLARPRKDGAGRWRRRGPAVDFVHTDPLAAMGPVAPAMDTTYDTTYQNAYQNEEPS
jgi:phosphate transport system permease protein